MSGINKAIVLGRLTRDPETKNVNGMQITNFSLATSESWKDESGEKKEKVEYHNLVSFRKTAELVATYLKKGSQVYVEGKLQTTSWEADGVKKYKTEIVADKVEFLSSAKNAENTTTETATNEEEIAFKALSEDSPAKPVTTAPKNVIKNFAPGGQDRKF